MPTSRTSNFLPITNLNTIGKILNRLALKQLRCHVDGSPKIGRLQSAYRAIHSTEIAMTNMASDLLTVADSKCPSLLLSLDLSTAFDTLDHDRLLQHAKEVFEFDDMVLDCLHSHLANREHFVAVNGHQSPIVKLFVGVPQGSVLAHSCLLFSLR